MILPVAMAPSLEQSRLDVITYLNDHIQTTLEKDLVRTAQIEKVNEFLRVLRLLSARVGGLFVARNSDGTRASTPAPSRSGSASSSG